MKKHVIDALLIDTLNQWAMGDADGGICTNCTQHKDTDVFYDCSWTNRADGKGCSNCVLHKRWETCPHRTTMDRTDIEEADERGC